MWFTGVNGRFHREQLSVSFGIDRASSVFDFQDVRTLDQVNPSVAQASFALRTGSSRTAILLAVIALLAAIAAAFALLMARVRRLRVPGTGGPVTHGAPHRLRT